LAAVLCAVKRQAPIHAASRTECLKALCNGSEEKGIGTFYPLNLNLCQPCRLSKFSGGTLCADSVEKLGYKMVAFLALDHGNDWITSIIHVFRGFRSGLVVFDRI
jgi:hypothetical protein